MTCARRVSASPHERTTSPMTAKGESFSRRNRYVGEAKPITIREEAPEGLRTTILNTAKKLGMGPKRLRPIICQALNARPDPFNWSEYPNIWDEVQELLYECDWFRVYDIIEDVYAILDRDRSEISLEHVLPEKPEGNWPQFSYDEARGYYKRIGNLCLLRARDNSTAKNASFVKKQPIYANSPYELTKQVGAVADWTVVAITDRQKRLAQIAVTTWAL